MRKSQKEIMIVKEFVDVMQFLLACIKARVVYLIQHGRECSVWLT